MDAITFWTALGASATVGAACGAIAGVLVAWFHLRGISRAASADALLTLYDLFDDETRRGNRRKIWQQNLKNKESAELSNDEWAIVERTATEMDVVGTMLKYRLVDKKLIFERYAEVIIPLWDAISNHILHRRQLKGGFGWNNFQLLAEKATRWSKHYRKISTYPRFKSE